MLDKPEHIPDLPALFTGDHQWIVWTLRQIEKDFMLQGIPFSFPEKAISREEIVDVLTDFLRTNNLISGTKLPGLLYQLDIPEKEFLRSSLNPSHTEWEKSLAEAILFRCFTKVYWRQMMK